MAVSSGFQTLMDRVRAGEREAAAELLVAYKPLIRRRLRLQMSSALRDVTDSEELWSTMARRLDAFLESSKSGLSDESGFWKLLAAIARHAVVDKARVLERTRRAMSEDEPFARLLAERLEERRPEVAERWLEQVLDSVGEGIDQDILRGWLLDRSHLQIGEAVGLSEGAVRVRWHKIRHRLREAMEAGSWQP